MAPSLPRALALAAAGLLAGRGATEARPVLQHGGGAGRPGAGPAAALAAAERDTEAAPAEAPAGRREHRRGGGAEVAAPPVRRGGAGRSDAAPAAAATASRGGVVRPRAAPVEARGRPDTGAAEAAAAPAVGPAAAPVAAPAGAERRRGHRGGGGRPEAAPAEAAAIARERRGGPEAAPAEAAEAAAPRRENPPAEHVSAEFLVEHTQDGEYELWVRGPHLSEGSFGKVYGGVMARGGGSGEEVAVKVACQMYPELWADFIRRLSLQEHKMKLPELESAYIIRLERAFASSVAPHCRLLVMQLAELDYHDLVARRSARRPRQHVQHERVLNDILLALVRTHRAGYVHRDVKPENILLKWDRGKRRYRGVLADLDFLCTEGAPDCSGVVGSPMYLPPELWLSGGTLPASSKQDVFAAGLAFLGVLASGRWERRLAQLRYQAAYHQQRASEMQRVGEELLQMTASTMAALDGLSRYLPVAPVLRHMVDPDPQRRCSAEQCLFELGAVERRDAAFGAHWQHGRRGPRVARGDIPWRPGRPWPLPSSV